MPALGNTFTILQAGSVSGTFNGLPNNATFTVGGVTYRINYTATAVTLTVVNATVAAALANTGTPIMASTALAATILVLAVGIYRYKKSDSSLLNL